MRSVEEIQNSIYGFLMRERAIEAEVFDSSGDVFSVAVMTNPVFMDLIQNLDRGVVPIVSAEDGMGGRLPYFLSRIPIPAVIEYWISKGVVADIQEAKDRLTECGWDGGNHFCPPSESE